MGGKCLQRKVVFITRAGGGELGTVGGWQMFAVQGAPGAPALSSPGEKWEERQLSQWSAGLRQGRCSCDHSLHCDFPVALFSEVKGSLRF